MLKIRVIPVLLLKNNGLVKTVKFDKPTYIGDPVNAVRIFNLKEVDELIFLDIDASKENREPNYNLIADIASEAFMPFGYGGGIKNIEQIRALLRIGVEKIIINSSLENKEFIEEAVATFGSSTIVASIDIMSSSNERKIYYHRSKSTINLEIYTYIKNIEELGVGEIMINCVDRDGMYTGYDTDLLKEVTGLVNVPVIACGGARDLRDIKKLVNDTGCMAAAAGSMFVFYGKLRAVLITYPTSDELENLNI